MIDVQAIKRDHLLPNVAAAAGLNLIRAAGEYSACCPFHDERSPSFTIFDGGRRFHCFGCGASGDVFDFMKLMHGVDLRVAAEMLCSSNLPAAHVHTSPPGNKGERVAEAKAIWRAAQPVQGTLAEAYLRSRCLRLPIPESIRFAELPYGRHGRRYPVLVAAIASSDNRLIGIQRTYLNDTGTGKAAVRKPKLSLGSVSGGAIRLAPCARSMIICEGLEDGLTLMQELGRVVWVAAGAANLPKMQFPHGVEDIEIGGDADEIGKHEARKAADVFKGQGIRARTFFPIEAKDFNDELKRKSRDEQ